MQNIKHELPQRDNGEDDGYVEFDDDDETE